MEKPLLKFPVKGSIAEYDTLLQESSTPRARLKLDLPSLVSACNSTSEDTELHAFLNKYGNLVTHLKLTDQQYDDFPIYLEPNEIAPVSFARLLTRTMPNVKTFKLHYLHRYPVRAFAELLHDWAGTLEELDMGEDHLFGHVSDYKYMFGIVAELRNLKRVNVNGSLVNASIGGIALNDTTVWFFDSLFQAVDSVETLEVLHLFDYSYNFSISDESPLAKLLRQCDSSRRRDLAVSLDTPHDRLDEQLSFLRLITAENARVSKFKLKSSCSYSEFDSLRIVSALLCSTSLKEIALPWHGFLDTDNALVALRALGNHEYVEKLQISLPHDNKSNSDIVQALKSITGLKELHIGTSSIKTIRPILKGLSDCLSLEKVVIEDSRFINPPSSESVKQFVQCECEKELQDSLQQLKIPQLKVVSIKSKLDDRDARHDKLSETTQFWLKMNRVGRKALVSRPEDHQAWGKALIENKSDLDVSYYLFRNNPDAFLPCFLKAACTADAGETVDETTSLPPCKKLKISNP